MNILIPIIICLSAGCGASTPGTDTEHFKSLLDRLTASRTNDIEYASASNAIYRVRDAYVPFILSRLTLANNGGWIGIDSLDYYDPIIFACRALGTNADNIIRCLTNQMAHTETYYDLQEEAYVLAGIGPRSRAAAISLPEASWQHFAEKLSGSWGLSVDVIAAMLDVARSAEFRQRAEPLLRSLLEHSSFDGDDFSGIFTKIKGNLIETNLHVRLATIHFIARYEASATQALPELKKLMDDRDSQIREAATRAIAKIMAPEGDPDPILAGIIRGVLGTAQLDNVRPGFNSLTARLIWAMRQHPVEPIIAEVKGNLNHTNVAVRLATIEFFRQCTSDAISAVPDLRSLMLDGDPRVREAATNAVREISGK